MDSAALVVLLLAMTCHTCVSSVYNLTIHPRHARISEDPNTLTITCSAAVMLTGCQFIWRDEKHSGPVLDLTLGGKSRANPDHLDKYMTDYSYSGRGLVAGDCGIMMHLSGVKVWMVGCRVRTMHGGWQYAWADLFAHSAGILSNTASSREVIVQPGGEARLVLKASIPLDLCHVYLPGVNGQINFDKGAHSTHSAGRVRYHGAGVQIGECGVALFNVSEANNGAARCYIRNTRSVSDDYMYVPFIVAHAPGHPTLQSYHEGTNIRATCIVPTSRPAASVTWLLGEEVVRHDASSDISADPGDDWLWPWSETSIIQKLVHRLRAEDDGKLLRCVVSHPALARPLEVSKRITYRQSTHGESYYSESKMDDVQLNIPKGVGQSDRELTSGDTPTSSNDHDTEHHVDATHSRVRALEARLTEAKLLVEVAQFRARAEEARARAEEARARAAEYSVQAAQSRARAEEARALTLEKEVHGKPGQETKTYAVRAELEDYNTYDQDDYDVKTVGFGDYYKKKKGEDREEYDVLPLSSGYTDYFKKRRTDDQEEYPYQGSSNGYRDFHKKNYQGDGRNFSYGDYYKKKRSAHVPPPNISNSTTS